MKKEGIFRKLTALFMAVILAAVSVLPASAKSGIKKEQIANSFIETAGDFLSNLLPNGKSFVPASEYKSENFFDGTGFEAAQSKTGKWSLGSAEDVLTPDDLFEKTYYTGGGFDASFTAVFQDIKWFFKCLFAKNYEGAKIYSTYIFNCIEASKRMLSNKFCCVIKQKYTDMCVRAVSIDDGSDRGATAIAVVDCIGLANSDVREIRSRVTQKIGSNDAFSSITVAATHCHSCIDTQGIWSNTFEKIICNFMKRLLRIGNPKQGYDTEYMEFLYEKVADAVIKAYNGMEQGSMSYATKKINRSYFHLKKRDIFGQAVDDMNRIVFTPDSKSSVPTMIVNMSAHPYYTSIATADFPQSKGDGLSGDFVYYMGETVCKSGYNFMFFNGSVAHVYTSSSVSNEININSECRDELMQRYGAEMGKMALSMTKTEDEIKADSNLYDAGYEKYVTEIYQKNAEEIIESVPEEYLEGIDTSSFYYHPWYENWSPVEETALEPKLNTVFKELHIKVTNPVIKLAGKLYLTSNQVIYEGRDYYIVSEIGYMELGNKVKIALMPGEVFPDMQLGGGMLTAEKSYSGEDFGYPCIDEIFGEDTVVLGLANDAIGYIVPDNDYILCFDSNNHYHELFSVGKNTASTLITELQKINEEIHSAS